jgi:hypothetical protein
MRAPSEIRRELEEAVTRRAALWTDLSHGHDAVKSAEAARLSRRIDELWAEARAAEAQRRFGSPELIQARARAEERLERDARRKAA